MSSGEGHKDGHAVRVTIAFMLCFLVALYLLDPVGSIQARRGIP